MLALYVAVNLEVVGLPQGFVRKFRPKRFHEIGFRIVCGGGLVTVVLSVQYSYFCLVQPLRPSRDRFYETPILDNFVKILRISDKISSQIYQKTI
jgi:hypothetical protein